MYLSGIAVTLLGVYTAEGAQVMEKGFLYGYTPYVWFVICKYWVWPQTCNCPDCDVFVVMPAVLFHIWECVGKAVIINVIQKDYFNLNVTFRFN